MKIVITAAARQCSMLVAKIKRTSLYLDTTARAPAFAINSLLHSSRFAASSIVLTFALMVALVTPVSAQSEPSSSTGQRVVTLRQVEGDGKEETEEQILGKNEAFVATQINGKVISKYIVAADGGQRVIITFKTAPLARSFNKSLFSAAAQTARRQSESLRASFRTRLLTMENQQRAAKGIAAAPSNSLILREYTYCLSGVAAQVQPESIEQIRKMPEVEGVYIDKQCQKMDGYGIAQIGAPQVWRQLGVTGAGISIAVIDTGIDYRHSDLGGGFGPGHKVIGGYDFVNLDDDPLDDHGHGTHVAGIAAANGTIKGVAPDAKLFAVKVLDRFGFGFTSNIISGVEWAVMNGANIINMSLGDSFATGDPDDPLCQAVDAATQAGVLVVCAAGNSGRYDTVGSPAAARTAVAVGADDGNHQMAGFSSRGPAPRTLQIKPEVVAPGVGILSTVPLNGTQLSDPSGYLTLNGTSMASPHVAGAAALLLQKNPQWAPQQLKISLMEGSLNLFQDVMTQGSGEIDVYASATASISSAGGELSFGWDDLRQSTFSSSQPLSLTNTTSNPVQLTLTTQFNAPPGMQVTVSPSTLSLAPGASATASFIMHIDNAVTPNLRATPFTYGGMVQIATAGGTNIHRPFAICKAPKLIISADDILQTVAIINGSAPVQFRSLFSRGPLEMLTAEGNYDFFADFLSAVPFPHLEIRQVVREKVNVSTLTTLALSKAEAKNRLELKPIDKQGAPLSPDWTLAQYNFDIKAANLSIGKTVAGLPVEDSSRVFVSDVSPAFAFDASLAGISNQPQGPMYTFHASLHEGITTPRSFTFKPSDFNKTKILHKPRPTNPVVDLRNWLWTVNLERFSTGTGYQSGVHLNGPVEQTIYSIPSSTTDATGGYWSVDEISLINTGNLPFYFFDFSLNKMAVFRPLSTNILAGYDRISGQEIYRSRADRLLQGQGPVYWSGSMQNLTDTIRIKTAPRSQIDQKLFTGQLQEEVVHGLLPYTLTRNGQSVASGTLDGAMEYLIGFIKDYAVEMKVSPGVYDMTIPFTDFHLGDKPGRLEVRNHFDTTKNDPNPPFLTGYQLINPLDLLQHSPFLDAIPITGAKLRLEAADNIKVKEVTLSFRHDNSWLPLPVFMLDGDNYTAYIPWLGFSRDTTDLRAVVTDTSGNSLTVTQSIPNLKK